MTCQTGKKECQTKRMQTFLLSEYSVLDGLSADVSVSLYKNMKQEPKLKGSRLIEKTEVLADGTWSACLARDIWRR